MIREYEIENTRESMYNMAYTVFVIMTDKRYGSEKTQIAQFDIEGDAILFVKARQELEANAK